MEATGQNVPCSYCVIIATERLFQRSLRVFLQLATPVADDTSAAQLVERALLAFSCMYYAGQPPTALPLCSVRWGFAPVLVVNPFVIYSMCYNKIEMEKSISKKFFFNKILFYYQVQ